MSAVAPPEESAEAQGRRIGRYVLLGEIGTGAMGVVLAAYDPDLDRKVALKILRQGAKGGSQGPLRMRREAQAMAKLSHPNVAQVYEVAEAHGRLYLAMEFIPGVTLRAWLVASPRTWREVLRVYIEAGRGLAAAHAAGILHRDFKPDNAMIDGEGRVRVLDFGLSRAEPSRDAADTVSSGESLHVTAAGSLIGTPAYMSPEQHRGGQADARSDQFSFCVALWEALHGARPFAGDTREEIARNATIGRLSEEGRRGEVPPWVSRILERGLKADPDLRWPSMDALLAALSHDPMRTRRRWIASAGAIAAIAGAGYGLAVYQVAQAQVCSGGADDLIGVWDEARRGQVSRTIAAIDVPYAGRSLAATLAHLDAYAGRWVAAQDGSCEAHRRGQLSSGLFDRRMACLRQRRAQLAATVEVLGQTTRESVANVFDMATGLQGVETCEDDARLLADVPLPAEPGRAARVEAERERLARAQALERGGRHGDALAVVTPMIAEAEALGYLPHMAEVHLLAGRLYMHMSQISRASTQLDLALRQGLEGHADEIAAEAKAVEIFVLASLARRPTEALGDVPLAWSLVRRAGSPPQLAALLHNSVAAAQSELGETARSVVEFEESLALLVKYAPDDPLRWALVNNLALEFVESGQYERGLVLAQDGLAQVEARFDACYPVAASLRTVLAGSKMAAGHFASARADLEQAIACFGEDYPVHAVDAISGLAEIAYLAGDEAEARRQVERGAALAARRPEAGSVAAQLDCVSIDLDVRAGQLARARQRLVDAEAHVGAVAGAESMMLFNIHTRRALLAHLEHDDTAALAAIEHAVKWLKPGVGLTEQGLHFFTHARVLHALGRDRQAVMAQAGRAIDTFRVAGPGYGVWVTEVQDWLAAQPELRAP